MSAPAAHARFRVSPVFGLLLLAMAVAGFGLYHGWGEPRLWVFVFVLTGWVVSLCLHEFAHALTAYRAGDRSVAAKGYLSLDPLAYSSGFLSIVLPLLFLLIGGIGLPGGAVYLELNAIQSAHQRSLVAAAGPLATAICALALLLPFALLSPAALSANAAFWSAVAFLAVIEVFALVFNLLPLPGLDGFAMIAFHLPAPVLRAANALPVGLLWIAAVFVLGPMVWNVVDAVTGLFGLPGEFAAWGYRLFRFWEG